MYKQKIMLLFFGIFSFICVASYLIIFEAEKTRHIEFIKEQAIYITNASTEMIDNTIMQWQKQIKPMSQSPWLQTYFSFYQQPQSSQFLQAEQMLQNQITHFEKTLPGFDSVILIRKNGHVPSLLYPAKIKIPTAGHTAYKLNPVLLEQLIHHASFFKNPPTESAEIQIFYDTQNTTDKVIVLGMPVVMHGKTIGVVYFLMNALEIVKRMDYGVVSGINDALVLLDQRGNILLTMNKSRNSLSNRLISENLKPLLYPMLPNMTHQRSDHLVLSPYFSSSKTVEKILNHNLFVIATLFKNFKLLSVTTPQTLNMSIAQIKNEIVSISSAFLLIIMLCFLWMLVKIRRFEQEKLAYQEQFYQSQKLEALGKIVSNVAHDYNNLVMGVQGYAELIKEENSGNEAISQYANVILQTISRCKDIGSSLLTFSRKGVGKLSHVQLNDIVTESVNLLKKNPKIANIQIHTDLAQDLWIVEAQPSKLIQVIMNLGMNAIDAMQDHGTLSITTANFTAPKKFSELHKNNLKTSHLVKLSICDTGTGIPKKIQDKIFDPFFTTKEVGEGTGLGLSSVHGIIYQLHGIILLYSEEGKGTQFDIYFPATKNS